MINITATGFRSYELCVFGAAYSCAFFIKGKTLIGEERKIQISFENKDELFDNLKKQTLRCLFSLCQYSLYKKVVIL